MKTKISRHILIAAYLFLICLITGCAYNAGNPSIALHDNEQIDKIIVKGKTTQEEIRSKFGTPTHTTTDRNGSIWTYSSTETKEGVTNWIPFVPLVTGIDITTKSKELIINFNKKKIVSNYSFRATESKL